MPGGISDSSILTQILLVDDRPENILALEAVLAPLGEQLVAANSGNEALRFLLEREFAVILLDVVMPGLDGFGTAAIIRERARTRHIPIIFMTAGIEHQEQVVRGYALGAVDYIAKPFHPDILRGKVAAFVELYRKNEQVRQQGEQLRASEQRERERALEDMRRVGEKRYQQLAESMPQIVFTSTPDAQATYWNRRWFDYTGRAVNTSDADDWRCGVHLDDLAPMQRDWHDALVERRNFERAARFRRGDGVYRWHLVRAVPIVGSLGEVGEWVGTFTDIDDRVRAEESLALLAEASKLLAESLEYHRALGEVAELAARTVADFCAIELLEIDGVSRWSTAAGADPEKLDSSWRVQLVVRGEPAGSLQLGMAGSGRRIGEIDRALAEDLGRRICSTIDNARLFEVAQRERTALESAARMKDEFLAVLSHELRTPLSTALGWAQLLRTGKLGPEKTAQAIDTIERSAHSQVRLVNELLDVSRIITGKLRLQEDDVDLEQIIESAVESVRLAANAKQIELELHIASNLRPIRGDAERLQQVLGNLLSNALKFTPPEGRIEVRATLEGEKFRLVVRDSGAGIDAEFLPFVFDRFRQANSSATRSHGGLGLGLSIVRHLVELHGGTCHAESEGDGRGATMTVELPAPLGVSRRARAGSERPRDNEESPLEGVRVLVVEDFDDGRMLFQAILERSGAIVRTAANVPEALEELRRERPDVLVSDIGMPGQNGYDLIRIIRAGETGTQAPLPIIALTAYASESDRRAAIEAGFQRHLSKPVTARELVSAVLGVLRP